MFAAALTAACGNSKPTDAATLLEANERTDGTLPQTLRLTYDVDHDSRRTRTVTLIRRTPFAYREEQTVPAPTSPNLGVNPGERQAVVSNGRHAWAHVAGKPAEPLTGDRARNVLTRAFVDGRRFLDLAGANNRSLFKGLQPLPEPRNLPDLPAGAASDGRAWSLDCAIPAAVTLRLQFAADDQRLLGYHEPSLDRAVRTRYADWHRYGPLLLPKTRTTAWSNPDRTLVARLLAVELDPPLDDALFAGAPLPDNGTDGGPLRILAEALPGSAWLVLDGCSVNGVPCGATLVDTGATTTAFDRSLVDQLRLPAGGSQVLGAMIGSLQSHRRWVERMQWGDRRALQVSAIDADLYLSPVILTAHMPRVVLGGEELFDDGPILDLREGRLRYRMHPVTPLRQLPGAGPVVEVPARRIPRSSSPFFVDIRVNGAALVAMLDTGFPGHLHLTARGADRARVVRDPKAAAPGSFTRGVKGAGPETRQDLVTLVPGFELGPLRFPEVWASVQMEPGPGADTRPFEALIGAGALLSFTRIGIDGDHNVLEFELPTDRVRDRDGSVSVPSPGGFCGALFTATDTARPPVVSDLQPGSPAARAGLRTGEHLVSIDKDLVPSQDLPKLLRGLWLRTGEEVHINVMDAANRPRHLVLRMD